MCTVTMAGVSVVHFQHVLTMTGRARLWHSVHVLAALGMVDMFWPIGPTPVGPGPAELVFGLAAFGLAVLVTIDAARRGRPVWLWAIAATDMAAMAFMFVMTSGRAVEFVTVLLVAWFVAEGLGWASGFLAAAAPYGDAVTSDAAVPARGGGVLAAGIPVGRPGAPSDAGGPVSGWRTGGALPTWTRAGTTHPAHSPLSRVTLTLMSGCMAYMLLGMQFGMPGVPGMPGM